MSVDNMIWLGDNGLERHLTSVARYRARHFSAAGLKPAADSNKSPQRLHAPVPEDTSGACQQAISMVLAVERFCKIALHFLFSSLILIFGKKLIIMGKKAS